MQRAKNESSDPTLIDSAYAVGVVLLFASQSSVVLRRPINQLNLSDSLWDCSYYRASHYMLLWTE